MKRSLLIMAALGMAVGMVYHQVWQFSFVSFDDFALVVDNPAIRPGLTWSGLQWAFASAWRENLFFYPLSLASHMLDTQLFGLNPAGHHLTSVALHLTAVIFFFLFLRRLSGQNWRPALAAGLFAVHPLGVESVAWVAERSNVLCAALTALTLYAHARYARCHRPGWYGLSLGAFTLALLAKPTAVMVPLILLLLDWLLLDDKGVPSSAKTDAGRRLLEKVPFFLLAGLRLMAVFLSARSGSPVLAGETVSTGLVAANALRSLVIYLFQVVWPFNLSVYYPFPQSIPWWQPIGAAVVLILITVGVVRQRRRYPLLLLGWLWYLVFLAPSFGAVRSGPWPAMADHYVYIPLLGVGMMIAWAVPPGRLQRPILRKTLAGLVLVLLTLSGVAAFYQAQHFRNSKAMFTQALAVTKNNFFAHIGLGNVYREEENFPAAAIQFRRALDITPDSAGAHANLGMVLGRLEKTEAARHHLQTALDLSPKLVPAHIGMANLLQQTGRIGPAVRHYRQVLCLDPDNVAAHYNLGRLLLDQGDAGSAADHFARALAARPDDVRIRRALRLAETPSGETKTGAPVPVR